MLVDADGVPQPAIGTLPHWAMYKAVAHHPDLLNPIEAAIGRSFADALAAPQATPPIDSRRIVAAALDRLSSWWRGEFPRRFAHFESGAERGIFGMVLWNHLAVMPERWTFSAIADSHGYGQSAMLYWRL